MRTKVEALKNPSAGDRWEKKRGLRRRVIDVHDPWVTIRTDKGRTGRAEAMELSYFRSWAANAEYLGGAE